MAKPKPDPAADLYNVCSCVTGAQVIIGVPLGDADTPGTAIYERARLNAESRQSNPERRTPEYPAGEPIGLHGGVLTTYEVVSSSGLVVV